MDLGELEPLVVASIDGKRLARSFVPVEREPPEGRRRAFVCGDPDGALRFEPVGADHDGDGDPFDEADPRPVDHLADVTWDVNGDSGGLLLADVADHRADLIGRRMAPILVRVFRAVDAAWSVGVQPIEASKAVR